MYKSIIVIFATAWIAAGAFAYAGRDENNKSCKSIDASSSTAIPAASDAQKAFDKLKMLAGSWEAISPDGRMHATIRLTSMGSALLHEMKTDGHPEDAISMIHVDGNRLLMTHYCDAGNQPRFEGKMTADGESLEFDFLDVTNFNETQTGHMQRVVFTVLDRNHHTEDWSFLTQDGKTETGHLNFHRTKERVF